MRQIGERNNMNDSKASSQSQTFTIQMEVIPDDENQVGSADIEAVSRYLVDQLRNDRYTIQPTPTGRKGNGSVFDILLQIPSFLHENKDWLFASIPPFFQCLLLAHDQFAKREKTKHAPLSFKFKVNGQPVVLETSDPKEIAEVVKHLQTAFPQPVKVQVSVSKKKRHK